MPQGAVAVPESRRILDRRTHEPAGQPYSVRQRLSVAQKRRDGRRQGAAGPVRVAARQADVVENDGLSARYQEDIGHAGTLAVAALRQHGDIAKYYRQVMVPFEDSFFGNHDISQTRFENCWDELEPFETVVNNVELVVTP